MKATVRNGHLVSDDAVDLPEGAEVDVEVFDPLAEMDPDERAALEQALDESVECSARGELIPNEDVLSLLRRSSARDRSVDSSGKAPTR